MNSFIFKWGTSLLLLVSFFLSPLGYGSDSEGSSDDRRSKQKKSAAAALAASAALKVMCLQQMSEAMQENNSEKMNMAMMMCAQADALAQNGKENEEGSNKLGSGAVAATPSPTFEKPSLQTEAKSDEFNTDLLKSASSRQNSDSLAANSPTKPDSSLETADDKSLSPKDSFTEDKSFEFGNPLKSKENSSSQDNGRIALNEPSLGAFPLNNLNANPSLRDRNPASLPNSFGNSPALGGPPSNEQGANEKGDKSKSEAGATSNGGFDEMLTRYMGGGAANSMVAASVSGGIIDIAYGLKISGQRPKTIFEFASEQYQKAKPTKKLPSR